LHEKGLESGNPVESFIQTLDKRTYIPPTGEDDDDLAAEETGN
jgi:hypothetical protein